MTDSRVSSVFNTRLSYYSLKVKKAFSRTVLFPYPYRYKHSVLCKVTATNHRCDSALTSLAKFRLQDGVSVLIRCK